MKIVITNPPWTPGSIRAASRWPHKKEDEFKRQAAIDRLINKFNDAKAIECVPYSEFPFYLGYAAAVLEKDGHEVLLIDSLASNQTLEEFLDEVKSFSPDVIVMETSTPSFKNDMGILKKLSTISKSKKILCGPHVTALPENSIMRPLVDFVLLGEYEISLANLVNCIEKGGDIESVRGIVFKRNGKPVFTESQPIIDDIDSLPFPAWHLMPMNRYWNPGPGTAKTMEVMSTRGCPFKCTYCIYPQLMYRTSKVRFRKPKKVVDEIGVLIKDYNKDGIYFNDDTFTINKKHVQEICHEMKKRELNLKWACFGRADIVDYDMLKEMKEAGCVAIQYGVESGSQKILDNIRKGIKVEQIKKAFSITKKVGIKTHGTFMIGLPGESKETIQETIELIKEIDCDTLVFAIATPFPGTVMYNDAVERGMLEEHDWEKYDGYNFVIMRTEDFSREDIKKSFDYIRNWWGLYRKTRKRQLPLFIRNRYKEGGIKKLAKASVGKSLELGKNVYNDRKYKD
jgi:radical SAM superfamily enzyme YgiQ (UPF0313 family)